MAHYLIYFNREWVGQRDEAWIRERAPLAQAVVDEMRAEGVYVFAGGLESEGTFRVDAGDGTPRFRAGRQDDGGQWLGGFAVVRVDGEQAAREWAGRLAVACGWPQEVRRFAPEVGEGAPPPAP